MKFYLKYCALFFLVTASAFTQDNAREQGLVTSDPFWRQALGGAVLSLPSVQAQSAVVALDGGSIRAYSTAGKSLWTYSARGKISPYVTRSREGSTYFSRTNGTLIAVNRAGRELWRRDLGSALCAGVVTGWDGRLFVPVEKRLFCYTASGNLLWSKRFEAPFSIAPKTDHGGGIFFALNNNEVYRIDHFGRANKWALSNAPVVLVSTARMLILAFYRDGTIEAINAPKNENQSSLEKNNSFTFPKLPSAPIAAIERNGNIAAAMNDGRVAFISADKREIVWFGDSHIREMIKAGGKPEPEAEMLFDERGIYVLSKNGAAGFTIDGRRLWFTNLQNAAAIPAFGNDGVLYSGGKDWILYSYKIEDRAVPGKNALYGPIPEGNYGIGRPIIPDKFDIPFNEEEKKIKLEEISKGINSGIVGVNEHEWTSFLLIVSGGEDHITLRIEAIRLLGKIGSQETIPWLVNIFKNDNEPLIKSEAVKAIGNIGVDPQGLAIQTFLQSIVYDGSAKNDQILTSIALATGALCRFSGPPLSETGVKILNMLCTPEQPPPARRQAKIELDSLNGK
jgi:outer membrane protein assembly factor BamB